MAFKIEHRCGVQAPARVVWDVLEDLPNWSEWNPLYRRAEGAFGYGKPLTLEVHVPGQKPEVIRPVIASWTPNELLHWKLSVGGGLVRTTRYLEIETLTEEGCIFSNGEAFEGLATRFIGRSMRRAMQNQFEAMGEALKARAETRWQAGLAGG